MTLWNDRRDVKLVGNEVRFLQTEGSNRELQMGDWIDVYADVVGGELTVGVSSFRADHPSSVIRRGPTAHPEEVTIYHCVPVEVVVTRVGDSEPAWKTTTNHGDKEEGTEETSCTLDGGPVSSHTTRWHLRVTNRSHVPANVTAAIGFTRDAAPVGVTRVPRRVLNHAFGAAVTAIAPHVEATGGRVMLGFNEELSEMLGLAETDPLRTRTIDVGPIDVEGSLQTVGVEVLPGSAFLDVVRAQDRSDEWKETWTSRVAPDWVVVRIAMVFSDTDVGLAVIPGITIDVATIENVALQVYLTFAPVAPNAFALLLTRPDVHGPIAILPDVWVQTEVENALQDKLTSALEPYLPLVHRYFAELLARVSEFVGGIPLTFIDAHADDAAVTVRYVIDPVDQRATRQPTTPGSTIHVNVNPLDLGAAPRPGERVESTQPVDRGPRGTLPQGFAVGDAASLQRLDQLETMVFVMMENRSFDHLLGYLRTLRGDKYRGFPSYASNSYTIAGNTHQATMQPITNLVPTEQVMQILAEPHHDWSHVKNQVADGAMSGFAQDLLDRGDPTLALSYYTDEQLPNYYRIAGEHLVCNQWYAAHPGPTYPNRWATLTGLMPQLENFELDDPRLGFMREPTIFELLTEVGIPWVYYETNVSMIRMFGHYRLDDTNVLPYDDPDEGFEVRAREGRLPPIVFVEPAITGVPPLHKASDDHPPANLGQGQLFITQVYNTLVASPQWKRMAFVITYDEHGGFYDHVPPPGSMHGPPEWHGKVPPICTGGPDYMGVRVPTFVISPFVDPGSVSDAVFDHTSIIKSILTRHRDKLYADQLARFGPRVSMINHLGAALNRDQARPGTPEPLPPPRLRAPEPTRRSGRALAAPTRRPTQRPGANEDTFPASLARAMLPRPL